MGFYKVLLNSDKKSQLVLNKSYTYVKVIKSTTKYITTGVYALACTRDTGYLRFPGKYGRFADYRSINILYSTANNLVEESVGIIDKNSNIIMEKSNQAEFIKCWKIKVKKRSTFKSKIIKKVKYEYSTKEYYDKNDLTIPYDSFDNLSKTVSDKDKLYISGNVTLPDEIKSEYKLVADVNQANVIVLDYNLIDKIYNSNLIYYYSDYHKKYFTKYQGKAERVVDLNFETNCVKYVKFLEEYFGNTNYKFILSKDLVNTVLGKERLVIDKEVYTNLDQTLAGNASDQKLAKEIIVGSNYEESKLYLLLLLNKHADSNLRKFKPIYEYFNIPSKEFRKNYKEFCKYLINNNVIEEKDKELLKEYIESTIKNEFKPWFNIKTIDIIV